MPEIGRGQCVLVVRTNFSLATVVRANRVMKSHHEEHPTMTATSRTATLNFALWQRPPLFNLGEIYATPGAMAFLQEQELTPYEFLHRHHTGDWGDLDPEDIEANRAALHYGSRLLSSYEIGNQKLWVITEADRSSTTVLLPEEY